MATHEKALLVILLATFITIIAVIIIFAVYFSKLSEQKKVATSVRRVKGDFNPENTKFSFIINPSKVGADTTRKLIERYFKYRNLPSPKFIETTIENPGNQQAIDAVKDGADVVVACGGDGTVRSVACGLAKSTLVGQVQMGIIPIGTGNLLARNLNLPINDLELALDIVVYGKSISLDLGWCVKDEDFTSPHAFTVIAGVGFDANLVRETNPDLKKRIGFLAYFISGIKQTFAKKFDAEIELTLTNGEVKTFNSKLRSIMAGNCGRIPGFTLIPDAKFADGVLDIVAVDTSAGILGWGQIVFDVFLQNFGVTFNSKYKFGRIEHIQAKRIKIKLSHPEEIDVDGDLIGKAQTVDFFLDQQSLFLKAIS